METLRGPPRTGCAGCGEQPAGEQKGARVTTAPGQLGAALSGQLEASWRLGALREPLDHAPVLSLQLPAWHVRLEVLRMSLGHAPVLMSVPPVVPPVWLF